MKKFFNFFGILLICSVMFFLGYRLSNVDNFNTKVNNYTAIATNGFVENSLTGIIAKPIFGVLEGERKTYGQIWIREVNNLTEIRLKINEIPLKMTKNSTKENRETPNNFSLQIAKKCCGGLDYDYGKSLGSLRLETENGKGNIDFSTNLDFKLSAGGFDKIVLTNELPNFYQVIKEDLRDWPKNATEKPAPYFWINL